jgi:lipoate-protein ligase B
VIRALARFTVRDERRPGRIGIWALKPGGQEVKSAAIGVRVRRWVSYYGVAINLEPSLEHFGGIVPCGIEGFGVISLADLGLTTIMQEFDAALMAAFDEVFGPRPDAQDGCRPRIGGACRSRPWRQPRGRPTHHLALRRDETLAGRGQSKYLQPT